MSESAHSGEWAEDVGRLQTLYEQGDWGQLESELDRLTPHFAQRYGEDSPPYAEALMLRGLMLFHAERGAESLPLLAESAARYRAALGENNPDVALAYSTYADALMDTNGDTAAGDAVPYYELSYAYYLSARGPNAIETRNSSRWLANALNIHARNTSNRSALERADQVLRASLASYETGEQHAAPSEHAYSRVRALALHGEILGLLGREAEADEQFRAAVREVDSFAGLDGSTLAADVYDPYIAHLEASGRQAEADAVRAQAARNRFDFGAD